MQMPIHFYDDGEFITSPLYSNRTVVSDLFSACEDVKFTVSTPPDAGGCSDLGSRIWSDAVLRPRLTATSCILDSALCAECGDRFIIGGLSRRQSSRSPVIYHRLRLSVQWASEIVAACVSKEEDHGDLTNFA